MFNLQSAVDQLSCNNPILNNKLNLVNSEMTALKNDIQRKDEDSVVSDTLCGEPLRKSAAIRALK